MSNFIRHKEFRIDVDEILKYSVENDGISIFTKEGREIYWGSDGNMIAKAIDVITLKQFYETQAKSYISKAIKETK